MPDTQVYVGSTLQFPAAAYDLAGNPCGNVTLTWTSSNVRVALVDSMGKATGVAEGVAIITATTGVGAARRFGQATLVVTAAGRAMPATLPGTTPAGTTPPATQPQPRPAGAPDPQCATNPTFSLRNSNNACYERRPVARVPTRAPVPSSCTGDVTPAILLVNISASGEVLGNASVVRRSNCDDFNAQAQALVLDLAFQPAQKGGQNVQAWLMVSVQPIRN